MARKIELKIATPTLLKGCLTLLVKVLKVLKVLTESMPSKIIAHLPRKWNYDCSLHAGSIFT